MGETEEDENVNEMEYNTQPITTPSPKEKSSSNKTKTPSKSSSEKEKSQKTSGTSENSQLYYYNKKEHTILNGRYKYDSLLSEYSTYLLVKFKDLNKNNAQVIIKVFHKNQTDSGKAELNILQNLNEADEFDNAHIIRYTESFEDNGHFCIVLSGIFYSLTEGIHSLGSQSLVLSDIRLIALQLLSSLALLEQRNIIHGNLLLENIFIVESDHKKSLHIGKKNFSFSTQSSLKNKKKIR